jgi:hypothetical protein
MQILLIVVYIGLGFVAIVGGALTFTAITIAMIVTYMVDGIKWLFGQLSRKQPDPVEKPANVIPISLADLPPTRELVRHELHR